MKRLHYPFEVILVCVRWYVAFPLSLRNLEEMMAERAAIPHSAQRIVLGGYTDRLIACVRSPRP